MITDQGSMTAWYCGKSATIMVDRKALEARIESVLMKHFNRQHGVTGASIKDMANTVQAFFAETETSAQQRQPDAGHGDHIAGPTRQVIPFRGIENARG